MRFAPIRPYQPRAAYGKTNMLFLHISDIHFKHVEVGQPDDPNRALRNDLIADLKKMRAQVGATVASVLLSGDIAFAGKAEEYDFAYAWLENEVCPTVGCPIENIFVIPGNHDVDRDAEAGPAQVMVRASLRQVGTDKLNEELRKWMRDRVSADVIFGPIENYNRFAAKFLCALRPYLDDVKSSEQGGEEPPARPFARRDITLNDGSILRLWGFNSVLVSDRSDAEGRMLVDPAASQIEAQDNGIIGNIRRVWSTERPLCDPAGPHSSPSDSMAAESCLERCR